MPRTYRTIQGDMWDGIVYRLGRKETDLHHLLAANPAHRMTVVFPAGVDLVIPDFPKPKTALPPWKAK